MTNGIVSVKLLKTSRSPTAEAPLTAGHPMFIEAFVYEDVAGMAITTLTVPTPAPSTLALAAIGLLGCWG